MTLTFSIPGAQEARKNVLYSEAGEAPAYVAYGLQFLSILALRHLVMWPRHLLENHTQRSLYADGRLFQALPLPTLTTVQEDLRTLRSDFMDPDQDEQYSKERATLLTNEARDFWVHDTTADESLHAEIAELFDNSLPGKEYVGTKASTAANEKTRSPVKAREVVVIPSPSASPIARALSQPARAPQGFSGLWEAYYRLNDSQAPQRASANPPMAVGAVRSDGSA